MESGSVMAITKMTILRTPWPAAAGFSWGQRCPLGEHASPRVHRAAGGAAAAEALVPPKHSVMTIPPSLHIFAGEVIE